MPSFDEIKSQLSRLNSASTVLARKEIKELPNILWEDEHIRDAVQGVYNNRIGLLVATDRRLVFVDKGLMSLKVEDFQYDKISSIQYQTGWVLGQITIFASGNRAEIKQIAKNHTPLFAETVRNMIGGVHTGSAARSEPQQASSAVGSSEDFVEKLEKLARLKDQGIVTEQEFAEQKAKILSAMSR